MGIRGELSEPEIRVIWVNFDQGKQNLVQVCGIFEPPPGERVPKGMITNWNNARGEGRVGLHLAPFWG